MPYGWISQSGRGAEVRVKELLQRSLSVRARRYGMRKRSMDRWFVWSGEFVRRCHYADPESARVQKHRARSKRNWRRQERSASLLNPFRPLHVWFVRVPETYPILSSWELAFNVGGHLEINWREHVQCPRCRLNNRMRASIHLLMKIIAPTRESRITRRNNQAHCIFICTMFPFYREANLCRMLLDGETIQQTAARGFDPASFPTIV